MAVLMAIEPILAVKDVVEAANYYRDVLGFEEIWLWGEPPVHGGAVKDDSAGSRNSGGKRDSFREVAGAQDVRMVLQRHAQQVA